MFWATVTTNATTDCLFNDTGAALVLIGDCTTDETIFVPDGYTLDGMGHTITAMDPAGDHFKGSVIANGGTSAHVTNLTVLGAFTVNACDAGDDRLRGILFEGASGSITKTTVDNINQGPSGCQEGNAIEVRNEPFDGTHPDTQTVEIAHSTVTNWQKTGVICNGDVDCDIHNNYIGASATQANLAANSLQFGFGAMGGARLNHIFGNEWLGASDFAATAVLIFDADGLNISNNNIRGNSEIGIYNFGDTNTISTNRVFDEGVDMATHDYDYGIGNWGTGGVITHNVVKGFDVPYDGVDGGGNISVGQPQPDNPAF